MFKPKKIVSCCVVLISLMLAWGAYTYSNSRPLETRLSSILFGVLIFAISGVMLSWVLCYTLLVKINAQSMIITKYIIDRKIVFDFPKKTHLWRWDKRLKQGSLVSYAMQSKKITMHAHKKYEVLIKTFGTPESRFRYTEEDIDRLVKYWLYEFNEEKTRELLSFYNPLHHGQQNQFSALVKGFLGPHIKDTGVVLIAAKFQ